jgi:hypothetical protein
MVAKVKNYNKVKLFKITHFNLKGNAKEWYKRIELVHVYWVALKVAMEQMPKIWDYGPKGNYGEA